MSTSGGNAVHSLLYVIALLAAFTATGMQGAPALRATLRRRPVALVGLWLLVAVVSLIGLASHRVFSALSRQPYMITTPHHHQWWRLLTAGAVQDGGVPGAVFNLVVLAIVLALASAIWPDLVTVAAFLLATVAWNLWAAYTLHDTGAGNSGPTFFLAAGFAAWSVRTKQRRGTLCALGVAAAAIALIILNDAHGVSFLAGLLIGAALPPSRRSHADTPPAAGPATGTGR